MKRLPLIIFFILIFVLCVLCYFYFSNNPKSPICGVFVSNENSLFYFRIQDKTKWDSYTRKFANCSDDGNLNIQFPFTEEESSVRSVEFVFSEGVDFKRGKTYTDNKNIIYDASVDGEKQILTVSFNVENFTSDDQDLLSLRLSNFINNLMAEIFIPDREKSDEAVIAWRRGEKHLSDMGWVVEWQK